MHFVFHYLRLLQLLLLFSALCFFFVNGSNLIATCLALPFDRVVKLKTIPMIFRSLVLNVTSILCVCVQRACNSYLCSLMLRDFALFYCFLDGGSMFSHSVYGCCAVLFFLPYSMCSLFSGLKMRSSHFRWVVKSGEISDHWAEWLFSSLKNVTILDIICIFEHIKCSQYEYKMVFSCYTQHESSSFAFRSPSCVFFARCF